MHKSAKREFSQLRPMPCKFCGKVIRVDMYWHVARLHRDLVQLWRCPIAWCTTWKGSPQDCLEHLRNGHDVAWISETASIEKYAPPWTVRRELWTDSLRVEHSGISTDILLFSELGLSLTQHTGCTEAGCPTPCSAQTTLRDSGLFCHHRDVREGSQRRHRKPNGGRHLNLLDDYIVLLDRRAGYRRRLTMGRF